MNVCFSSGSALTFTEEPFTQSPTEGNRITLEWRYTFGSGSFQQLQLFGKSVLIVYNKPDPGKDPYIDRAYSGRLLANVTDTYTSITFLRVNRTDSATYTLTLISNPMEIVNSKVEISVKRKYNKTNIYTHYFVFCI